MKPESSRESETLTREQSEQLEQVLGDGFALYGNLPAGETFPMEGIVNEPFFGAVISSGRRSTVSQPDFIEDMRAEGSSQQEIMEEYEYYLDDCISEDAPHWRETNPFSFDLKGIRSFFADRFAEHYGAADLSAETDSDAFGPGNFLMCEVPFSKIWFELMIGYEFEMFDLGLEGVQKRGRTSGLYMNIALASVGKIGRLVEHYRWRFSYGTDAIRGRANIKAARAGGAVRARQQAKKTRTILQIMSKYIDAGKSISNSANLAFKAGFGTSATANRKLWTRHRPK